MTESDLQRVYKYPIYTINSKIYLDNSVCRNRRW